MFLGEDEPELADALITAGLLVESPVDDYSLGTPAARMHHLLRHTISVIPNSSIVLT